jgi:cell division protein FtsQ
MRKKKDENLTPWAKYQKEHKAASRSSLRNSRSKTKKNRIELKKAFGKKSEQKQNTVKKTTKKYEPILTRKARIIIGSVVVAVILICGYFFTPISRVQKFEVNGNKRVSTSEILKDVKIKKNNVILSSMFKEGKVENALLKKNTDIKDANISISLSGKVTIKVEENAVMGYVVRNKIYYTVKQDGSVVKKSTSQPSGDYPIFRNFEKNGTLKDFLKKYAQMPNEVQNDVGEVDLSPTKNVKNRLHFFMNDGNQVYAIMSTFAKKMKYYPEISASMKKRGMIDLQVGAFSRPNGWKDEHKEASESAENAQTTSKSSTESSQEQNSTVQSSTSSSSESTLTSTNSSESTQDVIE